MADKLEKVYSRSTNGKGRKRKELPVESKEEEAKVLHGRDGAGLKPSTSLVSFEKKCDGCSDAKDKADKQVVPVIYHRRSPPSPVNQQAQEAEEIPQIRQTINYESSSSGGSEVDDSNEVVLKRLRFDLNLPPPESPQWSSTD